MPPLHSSDLFFKESTNQLTTPEDPEHNDSFFLPLVAPHNRWLPVAETQADRLSWCHRKAEREQMILLFLTAHSHENSIILWEQYEFMLWVGPTVSFRGSISNTSQHRTPGPAFPSWILGKRTPYHSLTVILNITLQRNKSLRWKLSVWNLYKL